MLSVVPDLAEKTSQSVLTDFVQHFFRTVLSAKKATNTCHASCNDAVVPELLRLLEHDRW